MSRSRIQYSGLDVAQQLPVTSEQSSLGLPQVVFPFFLPKLNCLRRFYRSCFSMNPNGSFFVAINTFLTAIAQLK
jgi:hypothetical protein